MLKKAAIALFVGALAAPAFGHPTDTAYASRGDCEAAYATASKLDRERLNTIPGVTPGEAQRTFHDIFRCQYDAEEDAWFIVQIGPFPTTF